MTNLGWTRRGELDLRYAETVSAPGRLWKWAALVCLSLVLAQASTLAERIDQLLNGPAAGAAFWGVRVVDLVSGRTLYEHNAHRLFVPASNAKLFSTAASLVRLGPEHRFLTRVMASAPPDGRGRIAGTVALVGGGDPSLSGRALPYDRRSEFAGSPLEPLEALAAEVAALGIRQIDGDIVGDDAFWVWQRYAEGIALDDTLAGYGAPVTALAVHDNAVTVEIRPGEKAGQLAWIRIEPPVAYFSIDNRIRTVDGKVPPRAARIQREPGDRTLHLWGEIEVGRPGRAEILAIDDPAWFAAQAFRDALERRSILVLGRAVARHLLPHEVPDLEKGGDPQESPYVLTLASRSSMPLVEHLRVINKVSQNLHAEMALRAVARHRRGVGSLEASLAELKEFLAEAGIAPQEASFRDGSGLSRLNLVSPSAVVALLTHMWNSPLRDSWLDSLPVGGWDGTLRGRLVGAPAAEHLRAKTGTLTHVSALSGYLDDAGGRPLAFAILVNNYTEEAGAIRRLIDRLCLELLGNH